MGGGTCELPKQLKTDMKHERKLEKQQRQREEITQEDPSRARRSVSNTSSRSGRTSQAGSDRGFIPAVKKPHPSTYYPRQERGGWERSDYMSFQPHQQMPMGGATGYAPVRPSTSPQWRPRYPQGVWGFRQANLPPPGMPGSYFNPQRGPPSFPPPVAHASRSQEAQTDSIPGQSYSSATQGLLPTPPNIQPHPSKSLPEQPRPRPVTPTPSRPSQRGYQGNQQFIRAGKSQRELRMVRNSMSSKCNIEFQGKKETSDTRVQESIQSQETEVKEIIPSTLTTNTQKSGTTRLRTFKEKLVGTSKGTSKGKDLIPPGYTMGGQFKLWPTPPREQRTGTPDSDHGVPSPDPRSTGIRPQVDLGKMLIVETDSTSTLIGYDNAFDPTMQMIKIQRTDQWKQPMDRDFRISGTTKLNTDPIPQRKLTKNVIEVDTFKGIRYMSEVCIAQKPINFANIAIPKYFSFRYEGLDEFFTEFEGEQILETTLSIGYIGDSTMAKLRQWLVCWQEAHQRNPAAIKFTDSESDAQHLKSGIKLYDLTNHKLEDRFRKVDIVIIKTQIDFFETWYYLEGTEFEGEAIKHIICDIRYIIMRIREINNTASIIILGMNPVNIKLPVPENVRDDHMALDFVLKTDALLTDMVADQYDCSFLSIYNITQNVDLCKKPFFDTLHMGPVVNMVVARDIYAQIHNIALQRMRGAFQYTSPHFLLHIEVCRYLKLRAP